MKKKKRKWEISKFVHLPTIHGRLPSRPIYSMAVLYLTLHSLVSAIFSLIRNFAPIPNVWGKRNNQYHPYIESTTVLSDTYLYIFTFCMFTFEITD